MVELALTLPVLLTFVVGFMQICIAFYIYDAISELAREGTRYAMVHGSSCVTSRGSSCTVTASNVNTYVSGLGLLSSSNGGLQVTTTFPDGNETPGSRVKVQVKYVYGFSIPFTSIRPLSMSSSSTMYIIQ